MGALELKCQENQTRKQVFQPNLRQFWKAVHCCFIPAPSLNQFSMLPASPPATVSWLVFPLKRHL